jgi:hypothetical protein
MDLSDDDVEQIAGADRRAIDPPIQVDTDATPRNRAASSEETSSQSPCSVTPLFANVENLR